MFYNCVLFSPALLTTLVMTWKGELVLFFFYNCVWFVKHFELPLSIKRAIYMKVYLIKASVVSDPRDIVWKAPDTKMIKLYPFKTKGPNLLRVPSLLSALQCAWLVQPLLQLPQSSSRALVHPGWVRSPQEHICPPGSHPALMDDSSGTRDGWAAPCLSFVFVVNTWVDKNTHRKCIYRQLGCDLVHDRTLKWPCFWWAVSQRGGRTEKRGKMWWWNTPIVPW